MGIKKQSLKELGYEVIELALIDKAPWNYKGEDPEKSKKLRENLLRNGQVENCIVRKKPGGRYEMVNGNHRLDDMTFLGWKYAVVHNKGLISEEEAKRIAIETNETSFDTDQIKLSEIMKELTDEFGLEELSETMPFDMEQIQGMADLLEFDFSQFDTGNTKTPRTSSSADLDGPPEEFEEIRVRISVHTREQWEAWQARVESAVGYKDESKAFELAIVEAMNTPVSSIQDTGE